MPGSFTSMAYCAVPLTLSGVSRRGTRLADQAEILAVLELLRIHRRQRRGDRAEGGDLAVGQSLAVGGIDDDARLGLQRRGIDAPFLRGIGDQHLAHLRAGRPHWLK